MAKLPDTTYAKTIVRLQLTMPGNVPFGSLWRNSSQILGPGKARQVVVYTFCPQ